MPPGARSATCYPNLSFRLIDSGRFSAGHCLRRGDPFSHPSGSSAWQQVRAIHPHLNRKGGRKGHTPPARFCRHRPNIQSARLGQAPCSSGLYVHVVDALLSPAAFAPEPLGSSKPRPTRFGESRKRSVPLRVHSHSKELWFRGPPVVRLPTSNPFLTHGNGRIACKTFSLTVPLAIK